MPATAADVLAGRAAWAVECGDVLEFLRGLPDDAGDILFTSPPYSDARTYGIEAARNSRQWVEWIRPVVVEMCRVAGLVFLNVSDQVNGCRYQNGPEWLHADLTRLDGLDAVRPYIWVKSGPRDDDPPGGQPGSGAKHFQRNAYEPIYGYAAPGKLPPRWSDNTAFGQPPRWAEGGPMTQRLRNGTRKNTGRMQKLGGAGQPDICNPGNVIRAIVGGGHLGHPLAHDGEAPMPLGVAERFVCWFAPPGGLVLDPFAGSGTTCHAAVLHGRRFVGADIRQSQVDLCRRRMATVTPAFC
jgi:DNA modification methylase